MPDPDSDPPPRAGQFTAQQQQSLVAAAARQAASAGAGGRMFGAGNSKNENGDLAGELAIFKKELLSDIRGMFAEQESTMRTLLAATPPAFSVATIPSLAPDNGNAPHLTLQPTCTLFGEDDANPIKDIQTLDQGVQEKTLDQDDEDEEQRVKKVVGIFGDLGTMDEFDLVQPVYDVTSFYKTTGFAQKVARHHIFENVTLGVICVNAIYLGVDADNNDEGYILDYDWYFLACEQAFCVFFSFELGFRFAAFAKKHNCLRDGWFKFDSLLVFLMVLETWIMPVIFTLFGGGVSLPTGPLRLLRLLRLSRLVRLIKQLPELMTMFKGMFVASRAVGSSLLMVILLIYVFGIIIHMALSSEEAVSEKFHSLPRCMWTLLMDGTFMDSTGEVLTTLVDMAKLNTILATGVFMTFILLSAMTVMNMLIGVLCEVVSTVAQGERDEACIQLMKDSILVELKKCDADGDDTISKGELREIMKNKEALRVLRSLAVDDDCIHELQQMLFYNKSEDASVPIQKVMELLLAYRGDQATTVKHLVDAQAFTRWYVNHHLTLHHKEVRSGLRQMFTQLQYLANLVTAVQSTIPSLQGQTIQSAALPDKATNGAPAHFNL